MSEDLEKLKKLKTLLKRHDWYFDYSDDGRVWREGKRQKDEIDALVKQCGDEGAALFKDACPWLSDKGPK